MTDVFSKKKRSWIMSRIKGHDTKPERLVRSLVHRMGYRFRLNVADLPGKPDLVLPRHGKVIFVHGCFWHGHPRCKRATIPTTRRNFWLNKIEGNRARDAKVRAALRRIGWKVLVVWQCEISAAGEKKLRQKLRRFLALPPGRAGGNRRRNRGKKKTGTAEENRRSKKGCGLP